MVGRALSSSLWRLAAEAQSPIWIEYVPSAINVADAPSRHCADGPPENEFTRPHPQTALPTRYVHAMQSLESLQSMGISPTLKTCQTQWKRPEPKIAEEP